LIDDLDVTNATYLYKRAPEAFTKRNESLNQGWKAAKAIKDNKIAEVFEVLEKQSAKGKADAVNYNEILRQVLIQALTYVHIPAMLAKSYSSIESSTLKSLLGLKTDN